MDASTAKQLGALLKEKRLLHGFSIRGLAKHIDVDDSTLVRIEHGSRMAPRADILAKLATTLEIPLADIYGLVGYAVPNELPNLPIYLRTRYGHVSKMAHKEIKDFIQHLDATYGFDHNGPAPGEDE